MPDSDPEERSRVTLPKNLPESLKRLAGCGAWRRSCVEVAAEAERRARAEGPLKVSRSAAGCDRPPSSQAKRSHELRSHSANPPAGKANLIKASHSAGMKPPPIARMFRLPQSVVNPVLDLPAKVKEVTVFPFD